MIIDNVMYNNIDSVEKVPYGIKLCRFSEELMKTINPGARHMGRYACNSEMRFVTEANTCFVSLLSECDGGKITVYYGDYVVGKYLLECGKVNRITLVVPAAVDNIDDVHNKNKRFAKGVWRIHFHNTVVTVCGIDTLEYPIRPPKREEMPEKMLLSYGSSISHGSGSYYNPLTYVGTFARLAGVDYMAKGVGGSCLAEPEIADDFAKRSDWDFALMEIGINMNYDVDEFAKRFNYFADTLYKTKKKIIFVTVFPYSRIYNLDDEGKLKQAYSEIIRKKYTEFEKDRVLLIEGADVLSSSDMLSADGIHPSTEGHIEMGYNLYNLAKNFLRDC